MRFRVGQMVFVKKDIKGTAGSIIRANTPGTVISSIAFDKDNIYIVDFGNDLAQSNALESELYLR